MLEQAMGELTQPYKIRDAKFGGALWTRTKAIIETINMYFY